MNAIQSELRASANPARSKVLARFFKTGVGEYGEGDKFLGLNVPKTREIAKRFSRLSLPEISSLLGSPVHEERLCALLILVGQFGKSSGAERERIAEFYWKHAKKVNNWDLVDLSAPKIAGEHLAGKSKRRLYELAKSGNVWERRISIVSTYAFIQRNQFSDTLKIAAILLNDEHDLIRKAVGWMLREVGKRDQKALEQFLQKHYKRMPRTMLRYAIERFPEGKRKRYLAGTA